MKKRTTVTTVKRSTATTVKKSSTSVAPTSVAATEPPTVATTAPLPTQSTTLSPVTAPATTAAPINDSTATRLVNRIIFGAGRPGPADRLPHLLVLAVHQAGPARPRRPRPPQHPQVAAGQARQASPPARRVPRQAGAGGRGGHRPHERPDGEGGCGGGCSRAGAPGRPGDGGSVRQPRVARERQPVRRRGPDRDGARELERSRGGCRGEHPSAHDGGSGNGNGQPPDGRSSRRPPTRWTPGSPSSPAGLGPRVATASPRRSEPAVGPGCDPVALRGDVRLTVPLR